MLLKFKDRTWILLERLIEKGKKEGCVKHIQIPLNEWHMLRNEWQDLPRSEKQQYMKNVRLTANDVPILHADVVMSEEFVDKWIKREYDIYYRDILLIPELPVPDKEEKAKAETE